MQGFTVMPRSMLSVQCCQNENLYIDCLQTCWIKTLLSLSIKSSGLQFKNVSNLFLEYDIDGEILLHTRESMIENILQEMKLQVKFLRLVEELQDRRYQFKLVDWAWNTRRRGVGGCWKFFSKIYKRDGAIIQFSRVP